VRGLFLLLFSRSQEFVVVFGQVTWTREARAR
jgi:hypothetical protein